MSAASEGVALFNAGRFEEALGRFRAALAAKEEPAQALVFIGHAEGSLGRRDAALSAFVSAIAAFPRHLPAYAGLANALLRAAPARDAAGEKALRRALALRPGPELPREALAEALAACGRALRAAGDLGAAEKALTRSLALGRDAKARRRLLDVLRARAEASLASGDLGKAEAGLRRVLALEPGDAKARRALVLLLRRRGLAAVSSGRLAAAEKALRRAVALAPRDAKARRQRVEVGRMKERSERARRTEARLRKAEKARALRGRVGALVTAGRLALAENALRRAGGAADQLAEVLEMRERAAEAKRQAARAAKGERLRALLEEIKAAGQAYRSSARARKAAALLRRLLALSPEDARGRLVAGGVLFSAGAVARGRALLAEALRRDAGTLSPGERYSALMKLGRYKAAIAQGERLLDARPSPADLRALQDPWEWDEGPHARRRREMRAFEKALGRAAGPWAPYYRADLRGPEELRWFGALEAFPKRRYAWMGAKAGLASLCAGRFEEAEARLRAALAWKTADWRTRGFLAEALLCLRRPAGAFAEMDRARREAPADEAGQAVAWRGALDLWLGRYAPALRRFDEALRLGAPYALSWKGAALVKLGRPAEALAILDEALARWPRDLEAYVWRAEAKRALGRPREALADLAEPALAGDGRATPIWLWALVNRALAKAALGDRAGLKADFAAIPAEIRAYIRRRSGREDMVGVLEAGLELSRGFRREEYKQAIWMAAGRSNP